jgi:hypothetical protein
MEFSCIAIKWINSLDNTFIIMKKYLIILLSALALEIGSTMYISSVADKEIYSTAFWAFLGPFIALPFAGYVADEKTWKGRLYLALSSSIGYTIGALLSMYFILN